jgi:hypothetical protein
MQCKPCNIHVNDNLHILPYLLAIVCVVQTAKQKQTLTPKIYVEFLQSDNSKKLSTNNHLPNSNQIISIKHEKKITRNILFSRKVSGTGLLL